MSLIIIDDEIKELDVVQSVELRVGSHEYVFNIHVSKLVGAQRHGKYFLTEEVCGRTVLYIDNLLSAKKELFKLVERVGQNVFVDKISSCGPVSLHVSQSQILNERRQNLERFKNITRLPVRLDKIMLCLDKICIDVIALDRCVAPDDGQTLKDAIQLRYGNEAVELLLGLI